jgi:hypothetical protein
VSGRPMPVPVVVLVPWQQPVQGCHEVVVRSGADLDDHEPGRGVWHEQRQQPVLGIYVAEKRGALAGQVR